MRRLARVERRDAGAREHRRDESAGLEGAVAAKAHAQDRARRERPAQGEDLVAREVPERVGDEPALVPPMPRRTCGPWPTTRSAPASTTACVNRTTSPRFSPRKRSTPRRTCWWSVPSAPACMVTITTSADRAALATSRFALGMSVGGRPTGTRRSRRAQRGSARPAPSPGRAGPCAGARLPERRERLPEPALAVVERVVVGEVHHREARADEPARVRRRRLERVAVRAPGTALRASAGRERPSRLPRTTSPAVRLDVGEERLAAVGGRSASSPSRCRRSRRW